MKNIGCFYGKNPICIFAAVETTTKYFNFMTFWGQISSRCREGLLYGYENSTCDMKSLIKVLFNLRSLIAYSYCYLVYRINKIYKKGKDDHQKLKTTLCY